MERMETASDSLWPALAEMLDLWEPFMKRLSLIGYGLALLVGVRYGLFVALGFAALNLAGRLWWCLCRRVAHTQTTRLLAVTNTGIADNVEEGA